MIVDINGKLTEMTNFFQLAWYPAAQIGTKPPSYEKYLFSRKERRLYNIINVDLLENHNINRQLPIEIEKLYYSNMYYSPFKMVKRLYSLSRHRNTVGLIKRVVQGVSSNISLVYQIKSEVENISIVIKKTKVFPKVLIHNQIDGFKNRLASVIELGKQDLDDLNKLIDNINNIKNKKEKLFNLERLKKILTAHIIFFTINYLNQVGLNPPPRTTLPRIIKYDISILRLPGIIPVNPLEKYERQLNRGGILHYPNDENHLENVGGYNYSLGYRTPLYKTANLKIPDLLENNYDVIQKSGSYSSDYYNRGYGPSLKPVHIQAELQPMNGGCNSCHLNDFRNSFH